MAEVWRFFAHEDDFADIDEVGACERLGRVLSFPTISSMDAQTVDWQAFADLRAYMQQAWPRVFAAGEVELIDHSLLVTLAGIDPPSSRSCSWATWTWFPWCRAPRQTGRTIPLAGTWTTPIFGVAAPSI